MTYTYLASPYLHDDPAVRESRFEAVCRVAHQRESDERMLAEWQ